MNAKVVRQICYDWLASVGKPHGFVLSKRYEGVWRKTPCGAQWISIWLGTNLRYDFTFAHAIRIDRVETILDPIEERAPEFVGTTPTAVAKFQDFAIPPGLANSQVFPGWQMHAATEPELRAILERLTPVYKSQVFPFLDVHQDVEALHRLFMTGKGLFLHPHGAMDALTVAHFAQASNYDQLVEKYRADVYRDCQPEFCEQFEKLVRFLASLRAAAPEAVWWSNEFLADKDGKAA